MKPALAFLVVLTAFGAPLAACQRAQPEAETATASPRTALVAEPAGAAIYLEGSYEGGALDILVNGYPVQRMNARYPDLDPNAGYDIGDALVGAGNVVRIEARPAVTSGMGGVSVARIDARFVVSDGAVYAQDAYGTTVLDPDPARELGRATLGEAEWEAWRAGLNAHLDSLGRAGALPSGTAMEAGSDGVAAVRDSAQAYVQRHPLSVEMVFDSEPQPGVAEILSGRPLASEDSVHAFALAVRDAYRAGDVDWLAEHYWPLGDPTVTHDDLVATVEAGGSTLHDGALAYLSDRLAQGFDTSFADDAVTLRPWVDGRVWSAQVPDVRGAPGPFFRQASPDGGTFRDIYVIAPRGELRFFFGL